MQKTNYLALLISILCCGISSMTMAQVGIGTAQPDTSSLLEVNSTTQGMLTPRMTTAQRNAIDQPATGLLVYDLDMDSFMFFNGNVWSPISSGNSNNDYTGWADYVDGMYTIGSPLVLADGTNMTLPNNASTIRDFQKPIDVDTFYDTATQTITGRDGDAINITIELKAKPTTSSVSRLTIAIDIGGPVGEIYVQDFVMAKGRNVEHRFLSSFNAYTLNTWQANGGTVKIKASGASEVYNIRYVISRVHKAR